MFMFLGITVIRTTGFYMQRRVVPQNIILYNISGYTRVLICP